MLFSSRNSRRSLLIETNPYQILAAGFDQDADGATTLDCTAEFDNHDEAGLGKWLAANFEKNNTWVPAFASFVPPEGLLQRESLTPRKLANPDYLTDLVREQYRIEHPAAWNIQALSPLEGEQLRAEGPQRPALVCGVSHSDVQALQQRLLNQRILPYRVEMGILPLLGAITRQQERLNEKRAVVVVVIEQEHTTAYIIGKEGVHTPAPVRHGFSAIVQIARREFDLKTGEQVRDRLQYADDELLLRATKFVRGIGRELKPLVDSYEMTTGQPVGEIYCAYLPPSLSWITEPLAQVIGRTPYVLDCAAWQASVGITLGPGVNVPGQHWLGILSLVAQSTDFPTGKEAKADAVYQGPWRLNCRISSVLPSGDLVRRRFIANTIATTAAAAALIGMCWLYYVNSTLRSDSIFWSQRIRDNARQVEELNTLTKKLGDQTTRIDQAHALMAQPYQLSELIVSFGRTRLERMTIDTIRGFPTGVSLRGSLREPAEQASHTLRSYVNTLRQDPLIAPKFGVIALVSMERSEGTDVVEFEVACRFKEGKP